ncbi:cell surface protein (plasmid) [Borreliella chilensis]|uniref:Cell surface protein n=1 Tax=Borreliella chilensis TaxID=1245910 RepID=A0A0A7UWV6_9SPIR|nr:cell surface protein [Borreliella chilensis]
MKKYLLGFALAITLIACAQKGADPKNTSTQEYNDQEIIDTSNKGDVTTLPLTTEDSVPLFNGTEIFISKEKNQAGKHTLRAIVDNVVLKGTSDKNTGAGQLEGFKADKSKTTILISDDLNTITIEEYNVSDKKISSKVLIKHGSITEENYKANKLDSKKLTRANETTLEYLEMTDADNAQRALETLKNGIKLEGNLVGGKTSLTIKEGSVTLTKEIEKDGKVKMFLKDTASSNNKTGVWQEATGTLTISADSKKTKNIVFLTDGTITVQKYDAAGSVLEGNPIVIKDLTELKNTLK